MAIAEQFAGLEMDKLIGGPLTAAADASTLLANSTADFINRVGFDAEGKARTVAFMYQKRSVNEDGTSNLDEMKIDVPMLAIVPIPNLQIDEVNILFDMEVKQSEKQESSMDLGASITGTLNLGIVKVSVTGNVSAHSSNTRSSDNSAKYHVDVRATNHGTPEGLARVLDMMAANVAPSLVGSTIKDGNGQNLTEAARLKAERLKTLRQEISQIEARLSKAGDGLDNYIQQMKKMAATQLNVYQADMMRLTNSLNKEDEADQTKAEKYGQVMDEINQSWTTFQNRVKDYVKIIADSKAGEKEAAEMLALKALKDGTAVAYDAGETYYNTIISIQKDAVEAQKKVGMIEEELFEKKADYSDAMAGKPAPKALPDAVGAQSQPTGRPSKTGKNE